MHTLQFQAMGQNTSGNLAVPWTQYVGRGLDGYDARFGPGEQRVVNIFIVPAVNIGEFIRGVLGYSYADLSGNGYLHRVLPMQNPEFPWLYAHDISSFKPMGWDKTAGGKRQGPYGPYAPFQYYKVTVTFASLPYDVLPDSKITLGSATKGEQCRFVEFYPTGQAEILQIDMQKFGQFKWDDTSAAILRPGNSGKTIPFRPGKRIVKIKERWVWKDVPDNGLFSLGGRSRGGIATNLEAAEGTVNSATFMGAPPWVYLLESWSLTPRIMPVPPDYYAGITNNGLSPTQAVRSWDVTLNMIKYDPNPDYTKNGSDYTLHGHNLMPDPDDGLFYVIYNEQTGATLYKPTSFPNIFVMTN